MFLWKKGAQAPQATLLDLPLNYDYCFVAFRCCYCFHVNPARKQRPTAPKLETFSSPVRKRSVSTHQGHSDKEQKSVENCEKLKGENVV